MLLERPVSWKASLAEELGNKAWIQLSSEPSHHFKENKADQIFKSQSQQSYQKYSMAGIAQFILCPSWFPEYRHIYLELEVPRYTYIFSLNFHNFSSPRGMWGTSKDLVHSEYKVAICHHPHREVTWGADCKTLSWMRCRFPVGPVQNPHHPELSVPSGSTTSLLTWDLRTLWKEFYRQKDCAGITDISIWSAKTFQVSNSVHRRDTQILHVLPSGKEAFFPENFSIFKMEIAEAQ